ncbi:MAG: hypothetical protein JXB35_15065, partial [Anaerolineae bacterium]|nr:hypothetical protein [Anaerolineae bacterium]
LTFKTDTRVVVVVLNDLTTQYGRCRLQYNGRNLYPRLRDVFGAPKTETSGPQLTKHDTWVMGQLSTFADMGNIVDATMFDTVGGLSKSQLTSMSEEGRKALAEFINITMEELNQIIEEMV